MTTDPAIVHPPEGKYEEEMRRWGQYAGVRRVYPSPLEHEDQYMLVRSRNEIDARDHFKNHRFRYLGRLAFNVPFEKSPACLINISLGIGRLWHIR